MYRLSFDRQWSFVYAVNKSCQRGFSGIYHNAILIIDKCDFSLSGEK